jgi:hypothetical protein
MWRLCVPGVTGHPSWLMLTLGPMADAWFCLLGVWAALYQSDLRRRLETRGAKWPRPPTWTLRASGQTPDKNSGHQHWSGRPWLEDTVRAVTQLLGGFTVTDSPGWAPGASGLVSRSPPSTPFAFSSSTHTLSL